MTENDLMNSIRLAICDAGHTCFRANVGRFRTQDGRWFDAGLPKGFSDLFGVTREGRAFFFEVKMPNGKVTPEQHDFLNAMRKKNAIAYVVRTVDDALLHLNT